MKRQPFVLVGLAVASAAAFRVGPAPGAEAGRAGRSLVVVDGVESREYDAFLPAAECEPGGSLNVEGANALSILARRGPELLRVEIELVP